MIAAIKSLAIWSHSIWSHGFFDSYLRVLRGIYDYVWVLGAKSSIVENGGWGAVGEAPLIKIT